MTCEQGLLRLLWGGGGGPKLECYGTEFSSSLSVLVPGLLCSVVLKKSVILGNFATASRAVAASFLFWAPLFERFILYNVNKILYLHSAVYIYCPGIYSQTEFYFYLFIFF